MQIWVSKCKGAKLGGFEESLKKSWILAAKYAGADLHFVESNGREIHGQLMERLWVTEIAPHSDREHIISEMDFQPYRQCALRLHNLAAQGDLNLIFSPYLTRLYEPTDDVTTTPGTLTGHAYRDLPLLGPWLVYLNLDHPRAASLGDQWLEASGAFNDAGNLALHNALEAGFLTNEPKNWLALTNQDGWPLFHGATYPHFGRHFFFSRALDEPADKVICWPDCKRPLTAGLHRENVRLALH